MSKELIEQTALFDYANIDTDTTDYLKQNAQETRVLLKRTAEDIIKIGKNLLEAKARLPHGQFIPWVKAELGISQSTAWRFMQVAQGKEIKGKSFIVNDLFKQITAPQQTELDTSAMFHYDMHTPHAECSPQMNAVHSVLWTGQLFNQMAEDLPRAGVEDFAWDEFHFQPSVTAEHMLYASRYPFLEGYIPLHAVEEMVELNERSRKPQAHFLTFIMDREFYISWFIGKARALLLTQFIWQRKGRDFDAWVQTRFRFPAHVAYTMITMLEKEYIYFPEIDRGDESPIEADIKTVPDEFVYRCADLWARYELWHIDIRVPNLCAEADEDRKSRRGRKI